MNDTLRGIEMKKTSWVKGINQWVLQFDNALLDRNDYDVRLMCFGKPALLRLLK